MTIGIAAYGPGAGAAVLAAWAWAEAVGSGSIGGFAVFTALPESAGPISVECQRGGLATIRAEWAGSGLIELMARCPVAAVITSGPDRPLPLVQFLVAGRVGMVTGHRLPNLMGAEGLAVNTAALRLMDSGVGPQDAVDRVMSANPSLDAGLIGVTRAGIGLAETAQVQLRGDRGQVLLREPGRGFALLHNSIDPVAAFADAVAKAGLSAFS